jgi:hypothetical protein
MDTFWGVISRVTAMVLYNSRRNSAAAPVLLHFVFGAGRFDFGGILLLFMHKLRKLVV